MTDVKTRKSWKEETWVSFDTETTGQYPFQAEFCELAAVKWKGGEIVDTFQTLVKPSCIISPDVIEIHGITNAMVKNAPPIEDVVEDLIKFFADSIIVAHHAAFDVGFLVIELEKMGLPLPKNRIACTSLLSQALIKGSTNHKLQTLIPFLGIEQGAAHRALDDAKACLEVALKCFEKAGPDCSFEELEKIQKKSFSWHRFSMKHFEKDYTTAQILKAVKEQKTLAIGYRGGSKNLQTRNVEPMGLVRSLDGDYLVAFCDIDKKKKRFYLSKMDGADII